MTCERQEDVYIRPRYPVDEPPTYRARCSCGWSGPGRYRWITDSDWERHNRDAAEPAAESWDGDDGLRGAIAWELWRPGARLYRNEDRLELADAILALPEVAALRAKAAAADRVRELAEEFVDSSVTGLNALSGAGRAVLRALDGPDRTDRGRC